jgi:hypothetical protein
MSLPSRPACRSLDVLLGSVALICTLALPVGAQTSQVRLSIPPRSAAVYPVAVDEGRTLVAMLLQPSGGLRLLLSDSAGTPLAPAAGEPSPNIRRTVRSTSSGTSIWQVWVINGGGTAGHTNLEIRDGSPGGAATFRTLPPSAGRRGTSSPSVILAAVPPPPPLERLTVSGQAPPPPPPPVTPLPPPASPPPVTAPTSARPPVGRPPISHEPQPGLSNPPAGEAPAGAGTLRDRFDDVDAALAQLVAGRVAFNSPERMPLADSRTISLLASPSMDADTLSQDLRQRLGGNDTIQVEQLQVAPLMEVQLEGSAFTVSALTPARQPVSRSSPTEWRWDVKANQTGRQTLHLTINAIVTVDGERFARSLRVLNRDIVVEITPLQRAGRFITGNWQWLAGTVIIPFVMWAWASRSRSRRTARTRKR